MQISSKKKLPKTIRQQLAENCRDYPIFSLVKGKYRPDSGNHQGLVHHLDLEQTSFQVKPGESFTVKMQIINKGETSWLAENIKDLGVVKIGALLFSKNDQLLDYDFYRLKLDQEVQPGDQILRTFSMKINKTGCFQIVFDLIAVYVFWFETLGSKRASTYVKIS